jgi:tetratricopeptide (TPR) repeat protein
MLAAAGADGKIRIWKPYGSKVTRIAFGPQPEKEVHPQETTLAISNRATKCVNEGRFDEALVVQKQLYDRIAGLTRKPSPYERYWAAVALLAMGKLRENRRVCQELLQAFEDSRNNDLADRITYAYVAAPVPETRAKQLIAAAEEVTDRFKGNERVLGACLYRAGEYERAAQEFEKSHQNFKPVAWDHCFLAMLHFKLGRTEEAAKALAAAREDHNRGENSAWYSRVETVALLAEAASLIEGEPSESTASRQK